jgi:hypothetical protein
VLAIMDQRGSGLARMKAAMLDHGLDAPSALESPVQRISDAARDPIVNYQGLAPHPAE